MINPFSRREFLINPEENSKDYVNDTLSSNHAQSVDIKKLGEPIIKFNLTAGLSRIVYEKYKTLYPKNYSFHLENGLLSSNPNINLIPTKLETFEEMCKSDKIPDRGLIIPDTTEYHRPQITGSDMSLLLDFVNIHNTNEMLDWVSKYGPLTHCFLEKYPGSQEIEAFVKELKILQTLYYLFTAVNEYALGNTAPLKERVKFVKITDHMSELELSLNDKHLIEFPNISFWGYDFFSHFNIKADKKFINKMKKKNGYLLFIDNAPTMSYFDSPNITDDILPIKTMKVLFDIIEYKTSFETKDKLLVNNYSITAEIQPNAENAPALYRLIPSIKCDDNLVLMYFQFLWLISTDGTKPCKKCGQYFLPQGERPGKQKYCGHCGSYAAQDQYKKKTLAAIKSYKSGLSIEQAASENKITINRLEKALKDGV